MRDCSRVKKKKQNNKLSLIIKGLKCNQLKESLCALVFLLNVVCFYKKGGPRGKLYPLLPIPKKVRKPCKSMRRDKETFFLSPS